MFGELVIRWTVRLAVACYVIRLTMDVAGGNTDRYCRIAPGWWTIGCTFFVIHVASAFHYQYGWNHALAMEYTARRTAELTGWESGAGLYVNEAFLCLWIADTLLWWRNMNWPQNRWCYWLVQVLFGFLMIQATAVFGPPFWKIIVPIISAGLLFLLTERCGRLKATEATESPGKKNRELLRRSRS